MNEFQNVTSLLQTNDFVVLITFYFTKAFDSVGHKTLMQKMQLLEIPDHAYNWMVTYFQDRGHATKLHDAISRVAAINASIIQGSVVGPASYVIVASDLHTKHPANKMSKYADDTYLMVGSNNIDTISEEFCKYSLLCHAQQSKNPS